MPCANTQHTLNIFIYINVAFAMYSGALLATAARLAWDPSTYTWFRFLCAAQYRVSCAYVLCAGLWLGALAGVGAAGGRGRRALHGYAAGVVALAASEVAYAAWMGASLAAWWRDSPQAHLARRSLDLLHDLKPALLAVDHYRDVALPLYHMIEEVEREAPNNAFVIIAFGILGIILQIAAFVTARRLARAPPRAPLCKEPPPGKEPPPDEESDCADSPPPSWRNTANLRMYTILDKIF